jgi:hypothetical protein
MCDSMKKINYKTKNILLLSGYNKRCNKFIEYCFGLSKAFYLGEKDSYKHLIPKIENYQYRLQFCQSRLPPQGPNDYRLDRFISTEDARFYGNGFEVWTNGNRRTKNTSEEFCSLTNSNLKFCLNLTGESKQCLAFTKIWPNAKVIRVLNIDYKYTQGNETFGQYHYISGADWPPVSKMYSYHFNIDRCDVSPKTKREMSLFFKWHKIKNPVYELDFKLLCNPKHFLSEMSKLYAFAEVDDFNKQIINSYFNSSIQTNLFKGLC